MSEKKNHIIAVVGMAGSGKGTVTSHLESKGYPKIYFGGMVYEEVEKRGLSIVDHEKEVREDMRIQEGKAVLAKRAAVQVDKLLNESRSVIVLDGVYSWSEAEYLKARYGESFKMIAVFTNLAERHRRAAARRDGKRVYTEEIVAGRDIQEIEGLEKGGPIAMADFTLLNNGTTEELLKNTDDLLESILNG